MRFKLFCIFNGTIEFPLREFNIQGFNIKIIKFVTDCDYELKLYKSNTQTYYSYTKFNKNSVISPYYFTLYRDGNVYFQISSTCDGILEFGYELDKVQENPFIIQYNAFRENAIKKFYRQFYKIVLNQGIPNIIIDERDFNNYRYHPSEDALLTMIHNRMKIVDINTNGFKIYYSYEVLFGFEINSNVNTQCQIYINDKVMYSFNVKRGCMYYPCFLLLERLKVLNVLAKFTDYVDRVKYIGRTVDSVTRRLLLCNTVFVIHENGMVMKYEGDWNLSIDVL